MSTYVNQEQTGHAETLATLKLIASLFVFIGYFTAITLWIPMVLPIQGMLATVLSLLVSWFSLRLTSTSVAVLTIASSFVRHGFIESDVTWTSGIIFAITGCSIIVLRREYDALQQRLFDSCVIAKDGLIRLDLGGLSDAVLRITGLFLSGVCLAMVSMWILASNPFGGGKSEWMQWATKSGQVIWPGAFALSILAGLAILMREWGWRRKSREQAELYLRTESIRALYPDLVRTARLRFAARSKGRRATENSQ